MGKYKLTKEELIAHCERSIEREERAIFIGESVGMSVSTRRKEEHEIFLRLLQGESVADIFNKE